MSHGNEGSVRAILYALGANFGIAVSKYVAAWWTNSGSMLAEAIHSTADCVNQLLLLFGMKEAKRPESADHPLGHHLDAARGTDDDGRRLDRLERGQRLAEEVRRAVVVVIGEPEIGPWLAFPIAGEQGIAQAGGIGGGAFETSGVGLAKISPGCADRLDGMAEAFERGYELAGHAAVAGDAIVSERVERGVERDAQGGLRGAVRV